MHAMWGQWERREIDTVEGVSQYDEMKHARQPIKAFLWHSACDRLVKTQQSHHSVIPTVFRLILSFIVPFSASSSEHHWLKSCHVYK